MAGEIGQMTKPKDTEMLRGDARKLTINVGNAMRSTRVNLVPGEPVAADNAGFVSSRRQSGAGDTSVSNGVSAGAPVSTPVTSAISTPFAQSPVASIDRPRISTLTKMGVAAVGLMVVIVILLVPETGPSDITEVRPLVASVTPSIVTENPAAKAAPMLDGQAAMETPAVFVAQAIETPVRAVEQSEPSVPEVVAAEIALVAAEIQAPPTKPGFVAELTAGTVAALRREAIYASAETPAETSILIEDAVPTRATVGDVAAQLNDNPGSSQTDVSTDLVQPGGRVNTASIIAILSGKE